MISELSDKDTIAAIATASGKGGIGIVRVSGPHTLAIAQAITRTTLTPRHAHYCKFFSSSSEKKTHILIDQGIAVYYPGPHSFTGEDCLELQGHGGSVILDCLLREVLNAGSRLARAGEFSERAYLNDKLDLAQAEAIADLINSTTEAAAKSAIRSLQGEFSQHIHKLVEAVTRLRVHVESAIDFPEEEIDFLNDGVIEAQLEQLIQQLATVLQSAQQGKILQEGMTVVIAGLPNAGKSSLLNALAGHDAAIVTSIEGTTRDVLRERIQIDGMPLHIIDTAGLRDSPDEIEREGVRRAWLEIEKADRILLVVDSQLNSSVEAEDIWPPLLEPIQSADNISIIQNKCDISDIEPGIYAPEQSPFPVIALSARENSGMDVLRQHLKDCMGFQDNPASNFSARRRHLEALEKADRYLQSGKIQLNTASAGELLAEDLRLCQQALGEITGRVSSDELLGEIFSSFCIGK